MAGFDPGAMFQQAVQGVTASGGNFFQDLIASPFRALGGMGQGAFNGVLKYGLWGSAITLGALMFAPDLVSGVMSAAGLDGVNSRLAGIAHTGGFPAILATSLAIGGGAGAAIGGVGGLISSFGRGGNQAQPQQGPSMGAIIGGGLAIAAVSAVAIGAVKMNGIQLADDQTTPPRPDPTPGTAPTAAPSAAPATPPRGRV